MEQPLSETPDDSTQNTLPPEAPIGEQPDPQSGKPVWIGRDGLLALAVGIVDLLFWPIVRAIPSGSMVLVGITTLISLFLVLLFTVRMARAIRSPRAILLNLLLSFLVLLPSLVPIFVNLTPAWTGWGALLPYWKTYRNGFRAISGLDTLLLIWLATSLGAAISRLVREFKLLLPMGVALAMVDLYTVFGGGVVDTAISGKNTMAKVAMNALTAQLPTMQPIKGAAPFVLNIGFADFLFIAVFFACFVRFDIPSRRTFQVLFVTLFLYMTVVFLGGPPLPALVPVAAVVVGMNWRRFRYERSEAFALFYVGLILSGILGFLISHSRLEEAKERAKNTSNPPVKSVPSNK
ncbi:MAG: hypothetical protein JWN14_648 [Chthonomonadales bacterium]|nr:hypothetical protein [Chthonomonadales bacterium]